MPQFPNLTDADSKLRHEIRVPRDVLNQQIVTVTAKGKSILCLIFLNFAMAACQFEKKFDLGKILCVIQ